MDLALQSALLGAVMGSAVLAVSTIYGWTLPSAPAAYGWWAVAFVLETASAGVLLGSGSPALIELSDVLHGLAASASLCGALSYRNRPITPILLVCGLVVSGGWAGVAHLIRVALDIPPLPIFGIGGISLLIGAWGFAGSDRRSGSDANNLAVAAFGLSGLHQIAGPMLHANQTTASWSLVLSQFLAMVTAVALLLVVLRRNQALAEREGQRANMLQSRLVDALGSVHDAVALFDSSERLVTCNDLYRAFLAPAAESIKAGRSFEDILKAEAEGGVVLEARGKEAEWVAGMLDEQRTGGGVGGREFQLWDGRWVAVSVYRTADGGHLRILRDVTSRKQTETALHESVAWLRGIMDTVVDGIITIDDSGTVLSYNPAAQRIFGYDAFEVVGRNVNMLMPEPYHSEHDGYISRYQRTHQPRVIGVGRQVKGWRKDGTVFPLELAVAEMHQGELTTFIGVVRDITDRKKVEDALVESEQRFRDLAESASDWFWETDRDLVFTFVSGRVRQVLGVGPGFFVGRAFSEFANATESAAEWEGQMTLMRAQRPFRGFVFLQSLPSGAVKYVEMAGRPSFDSAGMFTGYRGTATDITPLKRHEQELAGQSGLRQAIIDNMGQGVAVFDGTERLVALNRQARLLLDMSEGEVDPGMTMLEAMLLHMAMQGEFGRGAAMGKVVRRLGRLRRNPNQVFEHSRPNGWVLEIRSTAMPGGGLILTMTDITDRKKVEDTLREAKEAAERGNRAKATFLANISHELRTPLNAIIGFSELITHEIFGPLEPQSYRTYVDDIHESGMHLLELINDILDMSKAEAGMTDLVDAVVDVASLVRTSIRLMVRRASSNDVELAENLPEDLPFLRADERRLRQILLNLVSNAVKFTENGGRVTISARVEERGFVIEVADTGIGMSAEDMERVMEPFVQADTRLSRKYEGTGLGLPLTKALVNAHGGTISLHSAPEEGTRVVVVFPADRILTNGVDVLAGEEAIRRG